MEPASRNHRAWRTSNEAASLDGGRAHARSDVLLRRGGTGRARRVHNVCSKGQWVA